MNKYPAIVMWSQKDNAFLAHVPRLPGCIADGATREEAIQNLDLVIEEWLESAKEMNWAVPQPLTVEENAELQSQQLLQFQEAVKQTVEKIVHEQVIPRFDSELQRLLTLQGSEETWFGSLGHRPMEPKPA